MYQSVCELQHSSSMLHVVTRCAHTYIRPSNSPAYSTSNRCSIDTGAEGTQGEILGQKIVSGPDEAGRNDRNFSLVEEAMFRVCSLPLKLSPHS